MIFDPLEILSKKKENFENEWYNSKKYIQNLEINMGYPRLEFRYGKPHPIYDTINKLRDTYLRLGFTEVMNPIIVDEKEVQKQFGHESLAVLDRCFYLSGLPRPDIGISDFQINKIKNILKIENNNLLNFITILKDIFHEYKKGTIEGDDLVYEISNRSNISDGMIIDILNEVFPEFQKLIPISTKKTLRSHMTSGWFITLSKLIEIKNPPYYLFSIDRCFRREQKEDPSRLLSYYSASSVIMDENVTIDHGKAVAESILTQFGFEKFIFKPDSKKSKYYAPGTQIEVYAYHPLLKNNNDSKYNDGWIEIATFGIYSPCSLSEYNINCPVMNFGLGVERLSMILYKSTDMRLISFPQFVQSTQWNMSDIELCKQISLIDKPISIEGNEITNSIIETVKKYHSFSSPCEFNVWNGVINNKNVCVSIFEREENTKLCGPACFNDIIVYDGSIYGVSNLSHKKYKYMYENDSSKTNFTYLNSIANKISKEIEDLTKTDIKEKEYKFKMVKSLSDINLQLSNLGVKYITSQNKKIDVRGPLFINIKVTTKKMT